MLLGEKQNKCGYPGHFPLGIDRKDKTDRKDKIGITTSALWPSHPEKSFPMLLVLISPYFKHKSAWVLPWNSKPSSSQTQKYQPQGKVSPLKTSINVIPDGNKYDFFPFV